jgi:hypothetical protein
MKQKANRTRKARSRAGMKCSRRAPLTAMGRFLFVSSLLAATLGLTSGQANAQFLGHNGPGDFGLLSGSQPYPGLYLAAMYLRYDSDTLRNRDGDSISLDPNDPGSILLNADDPDSLAVNAYAVGIWGVTNFKIFGANYGFMVFPGFTDNKLEAPILGQVNETDIGFTDLYIQPINLGWHTERADFITGLGVFAPTGSYDPDASDNLGLGMWSFELSAGTTLYLDKAKTWSFATTLFYEIHTRKEDTDIRVGDILMLEGGLGKSFLGGALNAGVAYYAQWKVTDDDLGEEIEQRLGGRKLGKHRGFGVGPELSYSIVTGSKLRAILTARYFWETGVRSNLEGNTFVFNATFPIPSLALE